MRREVEVKVSEYDLAVSDERKFGRLRLFHFDNHVGAETDLNLDFFPPHWHGHFGFHGE